MGYDFDEDKKQRTLEAMGLIREACEILGWSIVIPAGDDAVNYLVLGTDTEVERIADLLEMDENPGQWN